MGWIDRWDIVFMLVAAYVAVMAMVRLMVRRRDQDVAEVEQEAGAPELRDSKSSGGIRSKAWQARTSGSDC